MDRKNFFHGQAVQAADMNSAFDQVEKRNKDFFVDTGSNGVALTPYRSAVSELTILEKAIPSMHVDALKGAGYTKEGDRLDNPSTLDVDCSVDPAGVATVPAAGQERYISVYALPDTSDSDSRVDPINGGSIDFNIDIIAKFEVELEASAAIAVPPTCALPALRDDAILLADILIQDVTVTIITAMINTDRKERMVLRSSVIQPDRYLSMPSQLGSSVLAGNDERWSEGFPLAWVIFDASGVSPYVVKSSYNVDSVTRLAAGAYKVFVDFDLFASADHCFGLAVHNGSYGGVEVEPITFAAPVAYFTFGTWEGDPPAAVENTHTAFVVFGRTA